MKKLIKITGMSCDHCVKAVEKALKNVEGISDVSVSLANNQATAQCDTSITDNILKEIIEEEGYGVSAVSQI